MLLSLTVPGLTAACVVAGISSMTARTSNVRNEYLFLFID